MADVSPLPITRGLTVRLAALLLLSATLTGCLAAGFVEKVAGSEPREGMHFALSAGADAYEITRWWDSGYDTICIQRSALPPGCETARFFLNDSAQELQIAQSADADWRSWTSPPLPDNRYPPCAILVSYGSFSEPQVLEGVAVASASGLITTDERKESNPAAYALMPAALVVDTYMFCGALLTVPALVPAALIMQNRAAAGKAALPAPVAACWTAIDNEMRKDRTSNPDLPFMGFEWAPDRENAYSIAPVDELFSEDEPLPVDARVTLGQGRVGFWIGSGRSLWTDADVECGLLAGEVVATRVHLRK